MPSDLKTKLNKNRVVISLRTSSKQKAIESALLRCIIVGNFKYT